MSRACVKEPDGDMAVADLPDRPISPHRNLVTPSGYRMIEETVADWRAREAALQSDDAQGRAAIRRELRYWSARLASAEQVKPPATPDEVGFGTRVDLVRAEGRTQTLFLVGEDESAPERGRIAWTAPLAAAVMGLGEGDVADFQGEQLEIVAIGSAE